jgi:hypothetical protein
MFWNLFKFFISPSLFIFIPFFLFTLSKIILSPRLTNQYPSTLFLWLFFNFNFVNFITYNFILNVVFREYFFFLYLFIKNTSKSCKIWLSFYVFRHWITNLNELWIVIRIIRISFFLFLHFIIFIWYKSILFVLQIFK